MIEIIIWSRGLLLTQVASFFANLIGNYLVFYLFKLIYFEIIASQRQSTELANESWLLAL